MASKESHPCKSENFEKAKWNIPLDTKILLDLCMDEIRKCGKPGTGFKHKKWEEIREEFNKRANRKYNQKQLRNRMDTLRTDWTTWKQLIAKETGLGWNHATGNIDADPSWWEAKIRENVKYAKFRYQGLEFRDEMEFIFGEAVATSQYQWTPALGVPSESNINNTTTNVPDEIIESDDSGYNDEDLTLVENTQFKKKRKIVSNMGEKAAKGRAKVGTTLAMRKTFERLVEAAEDHNDVEKAGIAATSHVHGQYSIPDCVKLLKKAKDEGFLNSQQFSYALEMLKDEQNRVLLISLKESKDDLVEWILYKYAEKKSSNN
ncbi:uncharacterized protein LOC123909273 [Trifolium pratense]|uniref:uncharacterized protein LOC123909273 n=1 Tax=Trifolium pratense TaxID=57577 RepID=UPI001E69220C|nr:uncharacterized protein LOC123909273 [Trifolium pratense]